jgi:hypothetical protein
LKVLTKAVPTKQDVPTLVDQESLAGLRGDLESRHEMALLSLPNPVATDDPVMVIAKRKRVTIAATVQVELLLIAGDQVKLLFCSG